MKKILSQFLILLSALLFTLAVYQANQYLQVSATIAPSLAELNRIAAAGGAEAAGVDPAQLEQTKQLLTGTTNALMQAMLLDFVLAVVFLLGGYFSYNERGAHGGL